MNRLRFWRDHRLLAGWLSGLATVGVIGGLIGLAMVFGGIYDTSASSPHSKPFAWAVHRTMIASVSRRAPQTGPASFTPDTLLVGMQEYEAHCIACHGGPGIDRARWASAMLPTPPFLVGASHHWSRGELFTIVHDGVKMTGMPAWGEIEPRDRILAVVTLLQAMPLLTPDQFKALRARAAAIAATSHGRDQSAPVRLTDQM